MHTVQETVDTIHYRTVQPYKEQRVRAPARWDLIVNEQTHIYLKKMKPYKMKNRIRTGFLESLRRAETLYLTVEYMQHSLGQHNEDKGRSCGDKEKKSRKIAAKSSKHVD